MDNYGRENELGLSLGGMIGIFLIIIGVGVVLWVVISLYLLFTDSSAFFMVDKLIPPEIVFGQFDEGQLFVPREIFLFAVPLSELSIGARIGIALLSGGTKLFEKPKKK